jgi:peptide/nickel transport system substrate-binding protein
MAACSASTSREASQTADSSSRSATPKKITAVVMGEPPTLNVKINSAGAGGIVPGADALEELVGAGLTHLDSGNVLHPQLAEAVPTIENGLWRVAPDGAMETTWKVRGDARWHDGTPFTTADLLFTIRVGQDRELPTFNHPGFDSIRSVEATDAQTITVYWKQPYIQADAMFTSIFPSFALPLPRHLLEEAFTNDRSSFLDQPYWNQAFVGAGPYKLREWVAGSHITLDANEAYTLGRPKVDSLEVRFIPDSSTVAANLLAGTVELTLGRTLSLDQGLQVRDAWRDGSMTLRLANWVVVYPQMLNPSPAVVENTKFRRALLTAIDRQEMAETILAGMTQVADSYVSPRAPEYPDIADQIVRYPFDPRRSTQMIEELGYVRGGDGFYRDGQGQRLDVELRTTGDLDLHQKMIFPIANYWQQVGVGVETNVIPIQRQRDREYRSNSPAFEMLQQGNDLGSLATLHSREAPVSENGYTGRSKNRYRNAEFDALIDRYFVTIQRPERMRVLGQIIHHISDQATIMGILYQVAPVMVGSRLVNIGDYGERATSAWNAHQWDVKN